jgi:hypothetical protein
MPETEKEQIIDISEDFRDRIRHPGQGDPPAPAPVEDETAEDFRERAWHGLGENHPLAPPPVEDETAEDFRQRAQPEPWRFIGRPRFR